MKQPTFKQGQQLEVFHAPQWYPEGHWVRGSVWYVDTNNVVIKWNDLREPIEYTLPDDELKDVRIIERKPRFFWSFIHNVFAHPLLITGTKWADRFHDWTADKM
jgi:hypothetical protein